MAGPTDYECLHSVTPSGWEAMTSVMTSAAGMASAVSAF